MIKNNKILIYLKRIIKNLINILMIKRRRYKKFEVRVLKNVTSSNISKNVEKLLKNFVYQITKWVFQLVENIKTNWNVLLNITLTKKGI